MDETARDIQHDVGQARTRVGAAMEAVGYRADMPARLRHRVSHIVHDVGGALTGEPDGGSASDTAMDGDASSAQAAGSTAAGAWNTVRSFARANALALGLGAFAVGVVAGMFIPRGKPKSQRIAPFVSEIRNRAVQTGEKVFEKSRQMARSRWAR